MAVFAGDPASAAEINAIIAATTAKPLVRLTQTAAQSLASDTDVAITFGASSEEVDTHGFHDTGTNTSRITPTVAGWYRLSGTVWLAADTDVASFYASIGKNGTVVARNRIVNADTALASGLTRSYAVTCLQQANGSSDYFELFGRQLQRPTGSALSTSATGAFSSTFECVYERPL